MILKKLLSTVSKFSTSRYAVIHLLRSESLVVKTVLLFPSLMVAPIWPVLCSGISMTTGWEVEGLNSDEWASFQSKTLRANSITATCIPRQTPGWMGGRKQREKKNY